MSNNIATRISKWLVPIAAIIIFGGWFLSTPPGLLGKADAVGYAVCHRIDERSFHLDDGRQTPLCARCSGMYLGAMLGLVFQIIIAPKRGGMPGKWVIIPLVALAGAFAIDGSNSYLYLLKSTYPGFLPQIPNLYIPNNTLRLFTGSGMGLGIAAALYPSFNQSIWEDWDERPALNGIKPFGILIALMVIVNLLVLTDSPLVLYPAAYISAGGVLLLLTMVYSIVWAMIMKLENTFTRLPQMWLVLLAGLTIGLLQISAIDMFRYWLTGTWGAFPLG